MERKVLEILELIPPMWDQHLIKKLIRHYSKEIEIATIARGIKDITTFELLLREFMATKWSGPRTLNRLITGINNESVLQPIGTK